MRPKKFQFEIIGRGLMKISKLIGCLIGATAFVAINNSVFADSFPEKYGYVIDDRGNVVKNSYGECWRTGYWTPAMAIAECDSDLAKKKAQQEQDSKEAQALPVPAPAPIVTRAAEKSVASEKSTAATEKPVVAAYFKAETLFDFDKSVVKPEGRNALEEKIVTGMKAHPEVKFLLVTGHTDRIGTEAYNQKLSERRANAVRDYLVKSGVAAERIKVAGKGESEPNPESGTGQACKGVRGKKLIACLQPDRRVTIESVSR